MSLQHEVVIIGSGFGGSVMGARLSKKWPGRVLLLERGRAYPLGGYPRSPHDMADNVWCPPGDSTRRLRGGSRRQSKRRHLTGMFDIRHFGKIDTITSAVLGGGSQIFANVFLRPPEAVFEQNWPATVGREVLAPYYDVAQQVLGARPVPPAHDGPSDRRYIQRTVQFQAFARKAQLPTRLADICVFFGNGYSYGSDQQPTAMGMQEKNRYGALQTSCTYCGECNIGCNLLAKNSLDRNYLYVAQTRYRMAVRTLAAAERIVPLNHAQQDDPDADGTHGYRVVFRDMQSGAEHSVTAQRVVVSAGALGSSELLLRCRDVYRSLPRISQRLGKRFSGNGDFLAFALGGKRQINSTYGPVITQYTDHHLFDKLDRSQAFILQDASYPTQAAWAAATVEQMMHPLPKLILMIRQACLYTFGLARSGCKSSSVGYLMRELFSRDLSQYSAVLLCMGLDKANGTLRLNEGGQLDIDWPQESNRPLYDAMLKLGKRFTGFIGGKHFLPMPTWLWPIKNNVTVHPLGGCALAESPEEGVVSAQDGSRGQVFGYCGLYVADGALMPTALGANPAATIAALSEWIAHDITGMVPDAEL